MKCPYCNGENIKLAGKLRSGKNRYYCKDCKKGFSDNTKIKEKIEIECPYCHEHQIKLDGKLPSGSQRYYCKSCKRGFSDNTNPIENPVNEKCPYCGGPLRSAGYNRSGTKRYKCKACGKGCSEKGEGLRKPIFKYINKDIECPYCKSHSIRKAGKDNNKQRYQCLECNKYFNKDTIIKEPLNITCPKCGKKHINKSGFNPSGTRRYKCVDCGYKFTLDVTPRYFEPQAQTCPMCGHNEAKKAGRSGKGPYAERKQYYKCCKCGHKFLIDGKYHQLTDKDKQFIIKFGVNLGVPATQIAKEIGCTDKTCRKIINQFEKWKPKNYIVSERERQLDMQILNDFLCIDTHESIEKCRGLKAGFNV